MILREGILYKRVIVRSLQSSIRRRINEAENDTPVTGDQCAANYLDEALSVHGHDLVTGAVTKRAPVLTSRKDSP
ncbi:hypothetical protein TNCV_3734531 [Trichonephila clavipes]|nr:hypothetical protein TNCV_3734531 [Trichonephila clavipes]